MCFVSLRLSLGYNECLSVKKDDIAIALSSICLLLELIPLLKEQLVHQPSNDFVAMQALFKDMSARLNCIEKNILSNLSMVDIDQILKSINTDTKKLLELPMIVENNSEEIKSLKVSLSNIEELLLSQSQYISLTNSQSNTTLTHNEGVHPCLDDIISGLAISDPSVVLGLELQTPPENPSEEVTFITGLNINQQGISAILAVVVEK